MQLGSVLLFTVLTCLLYSCTPKGKVSGTVNYGQTGERDSGAKVYFLNTMDGDTNNLAAYYKLVKVEVRIYDSVEIKAARARFREDFTTLHGGKLSKSDEQFLRERDTRDSLDWVEYFEKERIRAWAIANAEPAARKEIETFKSKGVVAGTDAQGLYNISLKPGKYYMLVVSNHVKRKIAIESDGGIAYRAIGVVANEGVTENFNFSSRAYTEK